MNGLYDKIKNRSKEEIKSFIMEALAILKMECGEPINVGFNNESNISFNHGFIPFDSRVTFDVSSSKTYLVKNTEVYYEFAEFISKMDVSNVVDFINYLYDYIVQFFGISISNDDKRDEYFDTVAFQTSSSDDDYYDKLNNMDLCDLKSKGIAMSSERAILGENIMTLFGIDSYLCFGVLGHGESSQPYAFNIVTFDDNNYIVDFYSAISIIDSGKFIGYKPFIYNISDSEFESILSDYSVISCNDYEIQNNNKVNNGIYRRYSIGTYRKSKNKGVL